MNDKFPHDPASIKHSSKLNWSGTRRTFIRNTSLMAAGAVAGALAADDCFARYTPDSM